MKLIVAVTGASGVNLSLKFLEKLPSHIHTYVVFSKSAKRALKLENNQNLKEIKSSSNLTIYKENQIDASIASGSFGADAMIILPCSMNTLAKCAVGISDNLITRAFSVMLKEKKNIIVSPREMPYSTIALENMLKLSQLNVTIAPPVLGYYSLQQNLEEMENFIIGKLFDLLKIENNLYKRWK